MRLDLGKNTSNVTAKKQFQTTSNLKDTLLILRLQSVNDFDTHTIFKKESRTNQNTYLEFSQVMKVSSDR